MNRIKKSAILTLAFAAIAFLVAPPDSVFAQSVSTGQLQGTLADSDGGKLPGVTVEGKNQDTGFVRTAVTDVTGHYVLTLLPPGEYTVTASLAGFTSAVQRDIKVSIGQATDISLKLSISAMAEEVIVTAATPVVETTRADVAQSVGEMEIESLPLNGRDFKDLVLLTPGTVDAGEGRVSVAGNRGIQNSFNIDGADSNSSFFGEERGGTRPAFTFSQAAIREFQVVSSSYNSQFGNATGGIVNAITKSGTNEFRGGLFYFFRDDSFVDADGLGFESNSFDQKQGGFTFGGPILRDRLHFFTAYDGQRKDEDTLRAWRDAAGLLNDPANRARLESLLGHSLEAETGDVVQTNDQDVVLVKFDFQLSANNLLTLRDNYSRNEGDNLTDNFQTNGQSTLGLEKNRFNSLVVALNSVLSPTAFNEVVLQYASEERPRLANNTTLPETQIGRSFDAVFGQNNFLPNSLDEDRYQIIENFSWFAGSHALKGGIDYSHVEYDNFFFRFQAGSYLFLSFADFFADRPAEFTQAFSPSGGHVKFDVDYISAYVQDEWKPIDRLTLNLGVRYELQKNPDGTVNPLFPQTGDIPDDTDNIAPRLGFAFDLEGNGKGVLRGGVGRFFNTTPTLLLANALLTNGVTVTRINLRRSSTGTLPAGFPTYPNTIPNQGSIPGVKPDLFVVDPDFENPETWRGSLGYERELIPNLAVGLDVIYAKGKNFERRKDINLAPANGTTADGRPKYSTSTRPNTNFNRIIEFTSDAETEYKAVALSVRKRFAQRWQLTANYTWSDFKDHDTNERNVSSSGNVPMDMFDVDSNWGPSDYDAEHNFVLSGTVILPWDINISLIGTVRSGRPYSGLDARDLNTDGMFADRPTIDGEILERNSFNQPSYRNLDLRLSKSFSFGGRYEIEIIGEGFNLTGEDNLTTTRTQLIDSSGNVRGDFGDLNVAGRARQYQAGLKFSF